MTHLLFLLVQSSCIAECTETSFQVTVRGMEDRRDKEAQSVDSPF